MADSKPDNSCRAYFRLNAYPWRECLNTNWREDGLSSRNAKNPSSNFMKTEKKLWNKFITKENFELACKNSQKGKARQKEIKDFNVNRDANLEKVRQSVINGTFHTSAYRSRTIYEPKERTIYILPYCPDRIVQHAAMNILKPIFSRLFIENSYACIEGRGQLKASIRCSEYVRRNRYCLKCDIHKFYPSINQSILSAKMHRLIKDEKFMALVDDVIFSFPGGYNCPIGNYMSQWFGNYYLTFLDNFVLHNLKCGSYERYCDDFMLFSNDKQYLRDCDKKIKAFLAEELELYYSRDDLFDVKQGVDFCGYRSFGKYVLVRKSTSKRMKKRFAGIWDIVDTGAYNHDKLRSQIASAEGWMKHACAGHLHESLKLDESKGYI